MNFEDMADSQINMLVCMGKHDLENWGYFVTASGQQVFHMDSGTADERIIDVPDYCNSPDDAWPIIVENKIEVAYHPINKYWYSSINLYNGTDDFDYRFATDDENPLRAAVVVYLKMKEAEK